MSWRQDSKIGFELDSNNDSKVTRGFEVGFSPNPVADILGSQNPVDDG